ncbi:Isoprene synthase, chloroplastic-like protein [Drosera capensis]
MGNLRLGKVGKGSGVSDLDRGRGFGSSPHDWVSGLEFPGAAEAGDGREKVDGGGDGRNPARRDQNLKKTIREYTFIYCFFAKLSLKLSKPINKEKKQLREEHIREMQRFKPIVLMEFSLQISSPVKLYSYHTKSWLSRIRSVARCFVTCARVSTEEQVKARSTTPLRFTPSRQDEMSSALSMGSKQQPTSRRSVNYPPNIWDYDFLESLASTQQKRANYHDVEKGLEENVKKLVQERQTEQLALLTLIDDIQRLGISHRFQEDIAQALNILYLLKNRTEEDGLNATALRFKLLRQHGFAVSSDEEFGKFKDSEGKFMTSLRSDVHGLLNLYEASYYAFEGEFLLDEANAFAQKHLIKLKDVVEDRSLEDRIARTLDLPLHHRLPVVEAKHTLKTYNGNLSLREIAKLNFNTTQLMYQSELAEVIRQLDLPNKLGFSRDRMVENFNAAVVMAPGPPDGDCRKAMAKLMAVLCVIDDIYDVYGSLEELKLFTLATERWDVNAIDELPEYMRLSFLAMFNSANEMAYEIMKKTGFNCLPYIKQGWCDLCKAYMKEAEWYFGKQVHLSLPRHQ